MFYSLMIYCEHLEEINFWDRKWHSNMWLPVKIILEGVLSLVTAILIHLR